MHGAVRSSLVKFSGNGARASDQGLPQSRRHGWHPLSAESVEGGFECLDPKIGAVAAPYRLRLRFTGEDGDLLLLKPIRRATLTRHCRKSGSGLVAVPSYAEFGGPAAEAVRTYYEAANADAPYRVKLFRLAFDAAISSFSGRQQLYERYYSGDPVRLASALYTLYDKDPHTSRIARLLEDFENCGRRGRG